MSLYPGRPCGRPNEWICLQSRNVSEAQRGVDAQGVGHRFGALRTDPVVGEIEGCKGRQRAALLKDPNPASQIPCALSPHLSVPPDPRNRSHSTAHQSKFGQRALN